MTFSLRQLSIASALHFLVDGLCACCLYVIYGHTDEWFVMGMFMLYNVSAFLTQPWTGMLSDRVVRGHLLQIASCVLLSLAVLWAALTIRLGLAGTSFPVVLSVALLLGLGNSLFHVWGGRMTAVRSRNDARCLGVFVSTGALGLTVGIMLASWATLLCMLLAICALSLFFIKTDNYEGNTSSAIITDITGLNEEQNTSPSPALGRQWVIWLSVIGLMSFVMFRSFASETFSGGPDKSNILIVAFGLCAMAGKMSGGWIMRGLGVSHSIIVLLAATLVCFFLKPAGIGILFAGMYLINCTMPITLYLANKVMPGKEGLAFGLLAASLMPGYMLAMLSSSSDAWVVAYLSAPLAATIVIELGVLALLKERRSEVLWSSVVVNILTNVPLNIYVLYVSSTWTTILIGELLVVAVETLWYWYFVRSLSRSFVYGLLCNAISFLIGLVYSMVTGGVSL